MLTAPITIPSVVFWAVIDRANIGLALVVGYTTLANTFALAIALATSFPAKGAEKTGAKGT